MLFLSACHITTYCVWSFCLSCPLFSHGLRNTWVGLTTCFCGSWIIKSNPFPVDDEFVLPILGLIVPSTTFRKFQYFSRRQRLKSFQPQTSLFAFRMSKHPRMNGLGWLDRQTIFLYNVWEPLFAIFSADNIHGVFNRHSISICVKEFAEEFQTLSLSSICSFCLKPKRPADRQVSTGWECNNHVPFFWLIMGYTVCCSKGTISVQQRQNILHNVPLWMTTRAFNNVTRIRFMPEATQLDCDRLAFFACY